MEKKTFDFYQDVKVKVWQRQYFSIEAETQEEAQGIASRYTQHDISFEDGIEVDETEWLYDTEELMTPQENGGVSTIEVYENMGKYRGVFLADNSVNEKKLENIISQHAYDELKEKVIEQVGEKASEYIFPAVKKALEEGDGAVRYDILIGWLNVDSMRVCSECGAIMEEGWYLNCAGYACSDECAAKSEGITMDEFERYQIYKDDIIGWLQDNDDPRCIDQLTKEECAAIIKEVADDREYYWTEWY